MDAGSNSFNKESLVLLSGSNLSAPLSKSPSSSIIMPSSSSSSAFLTSAENSLGQENISKISSQPGIAKESNDAKENGNYKL